MNEPHLLSLEQLRDALAERELSAREITEHFLRRIESLDGEIGAFVHLDGEQALAKAGRWDQDSHPAAGVELGAGLPSGDKDLVRRLGMPTSFGSRSRASREPDETSDPMALWLDQIGAISLGKTATSEFGFAGYTEPALHPPTRNPHNRQHTAGGSSGGAAAAVAAGLIPFAPGSDGGGSIRIPALACGVVGWKPSRGLIPWGSGFEHLGQLAVPGLITRTTADLLGLAPRLISGEWAWSTRASGVADHTTVKVGVTTSHPWPEQWAITPDSDARGALEVALEALQAMGIEVEWWDFNPDRGYSEAFTTVWAVAAASVEVEPAKESLLEPLTAYLRERGRATTAVELARALRFMTSFETSTIAAFSRFDAVLTPGLAMEPPALGWFDASDPERNFRQQVRFTPWTSFVNVAGLPAVTIPTARSATNLPMGVQLIGRPGGDMDLIGLANRLQQHIPQATRWPEGVEG